MNELKRVDGYHGLIEMAHGRIEMAHGQVSHQQMNMRSNEWLNKQVKARLSVCVCVCV